MLQTLIIVITGTRVIAHRATTALPYSTIRHTKCSMLLPQSTDSDRCGKCRAYRKMLNKAHARKSKAIDTTTPHSHTNLRYLSSDDKNQRAAAHTTFVAKKNESTKVHNARPIVQAT